jgi:hypothetical protein
MTQTDAPNIILGGKYDLKALQSVDEDFKHVDYLRDGV